MRTDLTRILDDCIEQVMRGTTIEASLAKYPHMCDQLEPLLRTALSISSTPKIRPSSEYVETSKVHLMRLIRQESTRIGTGKKGKSLLVSGGLTGAFRSVWRSFISGRRVAIPITVVLVIVLMAGLGQFIFLEPTPALASYCTLSVLSGSVMIQDLESGTSLEGYDGMTLSTGTGIRTGPDSHAVITFFEGSTAKLEPDTYLEIKQLEDDGQSTRITLKQWLGRTWNRVTKMMDSGSHYEIETPSATATVRGTLFTTEVGETGTTTVSTTEGLVSVVARGKEVPVSEHQQTEVETGMAPSQPAAIPAPISQIIITTDPLVFGSVLDPTGSSTGIFPTGEQFNQIQGSYSALSSGSARIITIADPVTGEYIIALRSSTEGVRNFRIQGISEGTTVFSYRGTWNAKKESGKLVHLNLQIDDGLIVDNDISLVEPLGDKTPEEVVSIKSGDRGRPSVKTETEDGDEEVRPDRTDRADEVKDKDGMDASGKDRADEEKDEDGVDATGKDRADEVKDEDGMDATGKDRADEVKDKDGMDATGKDRADEVKDKDVIDDRDKDNPDIEIVEEDTDTRDKGRAGNKKDEGGMDTPAGDKSDDVKDDDDEKNTPPGKDKTDDTEGNKPQNNGKR